ncbi:hypothetical protein CDL15_Pgr018810 [Punica granatum]|uniref:Uncharacterized protein n=2 Tax=Punica granatum TaxID=22663 RepID=A0A218VVI3_PUNGR|nr:hypothetical protein CDL15_Pgr018810 [Punica granatum]
MVATIVVLLTSLSVLGLIIFPSMAVPLSRSVLSSTVSQVEEVVVTPLPALSCRLLNQRQKKNRPSMEDPEPIPAQETEAVPPRSPPEQPPASAPAQAQAQAPPQSKKRPLESNPAIQQSKYFKMRSVLKDLRPHFIEVLKTSNFRECKAAEEIREHVKILMDLYRQMVTETASMAKCTNVPEGPTTTAEARDSQKVRDFRPPENHRTDQAFNELSENKQRAEDVGNGQSMIGGSAFGWNFVTFPTSGSEPVYYGVTKESFRAAQVNLQGQ